MIGGSRALSAAITTTARSAPKKPVIVIPGRIQDTTISATAERIQETIRRAGRSRGVPGFQAVLSS